MSFGRAEPLHGPMAERKVDLFRGAAGIFRRQVQLRKQTLRDTVVSPVLFKADDAGVRETGLAGRAVDESEEFESPNVGERGGRADSQSARHGVERDSAGSARQLANGLKNPQPSSRESLKVLHVLAPH